MKFSAVSLLGPPTPCLLSPSKITPKRSFLTLIIFNLKSTGTGAIPQGYVTGGLLMQTSEICIRNLQKKILNELNCIMENVFLCSSAQFLACFRLEGQRDGKLGGQGTEFMQHIYILANTYKNVSPGYYILRTKASCTF